MKERVYQRRIDELEDIVHRQRLRMRGLERKLERKKVQSALFVKHTLKIFDMCNIDWRDVVRLYDYCIAQEELEKRNDKAAESDC